MTRRGFDWGYSCQARPMKTMFVDDRSLAKSEVSGIPR